MNIQTWEKHVPKRRRNRPEPQALWKKTDRFGRRHWIGSIEGTLVLETEFEPSYPKHCAYLHTQDLSTAQARADQHIRTMEEQTRPTGET